MEIINTTNVEPDYILSKGSVQLVVYPRVHIFTFDLSLISGILRHGSLGYSLKNMPIIITVENNSKFHKDEIVSTNNLQMNKLDFKVDFDKFRKYIKSKDYYKVKIDKNIYAREHSGLGLSTQILGGVYLCCAKLSGKGLNKTDLFKLGLGHYSALGLSLLFTPGLIFEMGVKSSDKNSGLIIEPTLSKQYETPSNTLVKINQFPFYTIVAVPKNEKSISGKYEIDFWNKSLPDKDIDSYKIVYNTFENIIPSIIESDYETFITNLKSNIKLGTKPLEEKVQSTKTKTALLVLREEFGFAAISSLGPAMYAFSEDDPSEKIKNLHLSDYNIFVYDQNGNVRRKINDSESVLIASFACLGKTTFAKKYPDIAIDIESIHYARSYKSKNPDDEVAKCDNDWEINLEYPVNYVTDVMRNYGKKKIIFLTTAVDALRELDGRNMEYTILYPGPNRKIQILVDAHNRGNDQMFVIFLDNLLATNKHRKSFEKLDCENFVIIDDDQYIEQYISENYIL